MARLFDRGRLCLSCVMACAGALACEPTIVLGERSDARMDAGVQGDAEPGPGERLWFADHEPGDLRQWSLGGDAEGGYYRWNTGAVDPATSIAHAGSFAVRCSIETGSGIDHGARLYRRIANGAAYYSAWFWLDALHRPAEWWSIFLFNARDDVEPLGDTVHLWDLRLAEPRTGALALVFYDHLADRTTSLNAHTVPVQRWFQIEAYLDYAPPAGTRLSFWLDGQSLLDVTDLGGAPAGDVYWVVGNGATLLSPGSSTLYIDDAAIATKRLGP